MSYDCNISSWLSASILKYNEKIILIKQRVKVAKFWRPSYEWVYYHHGSHLECKNNKHWGHDFIKTIHMYLYTVMRISILKQIGWLLLTISHTRTHAKYVRTWWNSDIKIVSPWTIIQLQFKRQILTFLSVWMAPMLCCSAFESKNQKYWICSFHFPRREYPFYGQIIVGIFFI